MAVLWTAEPPAIAGLSGGWERNRRMEQRSRAARCPL